MARHAVHTTEGLTFQLELAGAGTRFLAGALDALLVTSILLLLGLLLRVLGLGEVGRFLAGLLLSGAVLLFVAYHALLPLALDGRTPGKRQLGVRVVSVDGGAPRAGQLLLRALLLPVDCLPFPLPIGLIAIAATDQRQRPGDLVAGTLVARDARTQRLREPWSSDTWSGLEARALPLGPALAVRLDAEDLDFLRTLVTRRGMGAAEREALFRRVTGHYLRVLGIESDVEPRRALRELFLFAREHVRA